MDAVELWRESIPEESRVEAAAGATLLGAGLIAATYTLAHHRRGFLSWALPGALLGAGVAMILDVLLDDRRENMAEARAEIEERLAELDPIARAQVLKSVGESQFRALMPRRG
jgi:hypothetical protein